MKILYILLLLSLSYSATLLVPDEYDSIQSAIDAASEGDSVLVSAGTYLENINFNGKNISVIGEDRETTIIDGNQSGSVVVFDSGEDSTAIISGFTITNGYASFGAGINLNNSNPILRDLIVMGNTVYQDNSCGGGINCLGASPLIENVIIMENSSNSNGGGFCSWTDSNPILSNVVIKYNNAEYGGGVSCNNSFPVFQHVEISNNDATYRGGGLLAWGECDPVLTNVTITNNISDDRGGGLYIHANSESIVKNSILYSNSAPDGNQIFYYGLIDISYSDIQGGWEGIATNDNGEIYWLEGNIDSDPLFVDPENGDYTLQSISPCIDAGDPASELDPDGTRADMGAYYYHQEQGCAGPCGQELDACGSVINSCWPCCMLGMCGLATGQAECEEGFGSFYPYYLGDGFSCGGLEGEGTPNPPPMDECGVCGGDNSSCSGCTDPEATNYNPDATIDDGSCEYLDIEATLSFGVLDLSSHTLEINLENTMPVSGFQFEVDLGESMAITEVSGGSTEEMGFMVDFSENNNVVLGFSIDGNEIDVGIETLANLTFSGYGQATVCLSNAIIISGFEDAEYFDVEYGYCITINYMKGDVNLDEALDILDLVMVMNIIFENIAPDENEIWAADYNSDGDINIMDIVQIVNCILSGCWEGEPLCDIDGNCYETIQIGEQVWMAENLKVTHYRDGSDIPTGYSNSEWTQLETGAYAVYPIDDDNASQTTCGDDCVDVYGNLYNWYTVDDSRGVCPDGFHVPSDEEFMELEMFLGMSEEEANSDGWRGTDEGSKLAGNSDLWLESYLVNNSEFGTSGFTALPAGYRNYYDGNYTAVGNLGYFWSSSESSSLNAWYRLLSYYDSNVDRNFSYKQYGFSVRCLGD